MTCTTMASSSSRRARLDGATLYRTRSSSQLPSSGFMSSSAFHLRSFSTSRVSNHGSSSISVTKQSNGGVRGNDQNKKKTCMCSPTSHPGSFRCSLHKNSPRGSLQQQMPSSRSNNSGLNLIKLAMANSMIKIGIVEANMMKKSSLSSLIRPSSHHQERRAGFQPRRSRLSAMSKAEDS